MDRAILSRLSSHGVTAEIKYRTMFPQNAPAYDMAIGCEASGGDRLAAIADMENFMTPAPIREIEQWLAELSVLTAGRGREGFDAELMVTAYSSRLAQYPADVARHALLGKSWKWFPSWDELKSVCDAQTAPRRVIMAALRKPEPEPVPEADERVITEAKRQAALRCIEENFPHVAAGWKQRALDEISGEKA